MSLLSVILALIAESFINNVSEFRRYNAFYRYVDWLRPKLPTFSFKNGPVSLVLVVSGLLFAVWLVAAMLGNVLGLFEFLFGIAVLIFTIGPRDLDEDSQKVIAAFEENDYVSAKHHASDLLGRDISESESPAQLAEMVKEAIFVQTNTRLLGVFFWFILLGPVGAVLFRVSCLLKEHNADGTDEFADASRDLYRIMFWLPARICVLSFAVAGNFVDTMSRWKGLSDLWLRDSEELIIISGTGSLGLEASVEAEAIENDEPDVHAIHQAVSLVKRSLIVWVVLLALLTVTGWLF